MAEDKNKHKEVQATDEEVVKDDLINMNERLEEEVNKLEHVINYRHVKFANNYVKNGGNAGQAYIDAGYSVKNMASAYACASRLLKKDDIKALISKRTAIMLNNNLIASKDDVLMGLTEIAFREDSSDSDKISAYKLLGNFLQLWDNKQSVSTDITINLGGKKDKEILEGDYEEVSVTGIETE